jgi:glycerate 2-kinase
LLNCLRGSLSAHEVAAAVVAGAEAADANVTAIPLADGGDGSTDVWLRIRGGEVHRYMVRDPLGAGRYARLVISSDGCAFVEMAEASGLSCLTNRSLDPWHSNTYGTGELICNAAVAGATSIVISAGGSATLDMGAGVLAALGATFTDERGAVLRPVPAELRYVRHANLDSLKPRVRLLNVTVLSDVSTPLRDSAATYGPQKGIAAADMPAFTDMLTAVANSLGLSTGDVLSAPWLGAGGGLGAGLTTLGATAASGSSYMLDLADAEALLADADVVITSEGCVDAGSLQGKLAMSVARLASRHGVPCVVIAGACRLALGDLPRGCTVVCVPASGRAGQATADDFAATVTRVVDHHRRKTRNLSSSGPAETPVRASNSACGTKGDC